MAALAPKSLHKGQTGMSAILSTRSEPDGPLLMRWTALLPHAAMIARIEPEES